MLKINYSGAFISLLSISVCLVFNDFIENVIGLVLILSVGIIHGANDLLIIKNISGKTSKNSYVKSFILYIFVVLLGIALFYIFPKLAIYLFVSISIFHFGEQYLESKGIYKIQNNWFLSVFTPFILHGLLVFNLIFLNNLADVNLILEKFTINELSNNILNITLLIISFFYLISILYNSSVRIHFINEVLFFGLFYIITKNSTLLFSFAFYFAFFHSILSMNDQIKFVYGKVSYSNIRKYILFASPYFILALIFLYILYNNFNVYSDQFLPLFFSFLAAITFPHVFVIEKMYNKMK
ncbi:MAG: Brp/Blh family beta-carotene 15,15'-dioxygenase [Bacteroidota bacterium]|nr:Brp/Blh family beta-carotene 15,15'-dioxygenase [Bacteroidota bacterium]